MPENKLTEIGFKLGNGIALGQLRVIAAITYCMRFGLYCRDVGKDTIAKDCSEEVFRASGEAPISADSSEQN